MPLIDLCENYWPAITGAVLAALAESPRLPYQEDRLKENHEEDTWILSPPDEPGEAENPRTPGDLLDWVSDILLPKLRLKVPSSGEPDTVLATAGLMSYLGDLCERKPPVAVVLEVIALTTGAGGLSNIIQRLIAFGCTWNRPAAHAPGAAGWTGVWTNAYMEMIYATEVHVVHQLRRLRMTVNGFGSLIDSRIPWGRDRWRWLFSVATLVVGKCIQQAPDPLPWKFHQYLYLDFWDPTVSSLYNWISVMLCGSAVGTRGQVEQKSFNYGRLGQCLANEALLHSGKVALRSCRNPKCPEYNGLKRFGYVTRCPEPGCNTDFQVYTPEDRLIIPDDRYFCGIRLRRCRSEGKPEHYVAANPNVEVCPLHPAVPLSPDISQLWINVAPSARPIGNSNS